MSKPLTNEAVFRIEVSLSSRKSSAIVMRTQARLYTLDKGSIEAATPSKLWCQHIIASHNSSILVCIHISFALAVDAQWKSLAYGAPCIQLMRENTDHNSPFHIKVVIAEVESGTYKLYYTTTLPVLY